MISWSRTLYVYKDFWYTYYKSIGHRQMFLLPADSADRADVVYTETPDCRHYGRVSDYPWRSIDAALLLREWLITIIRIVYAVHLKVLSVGHPTVEDWRTGR